MPKEIYLTPRTATVDDVNPFMGVASHDPYGNIEMVTTGATINSIAPIKNTYLSDMRIPETHQKAIEGDLNVRGNVDIDRGELIPIGSELVNTAGYLHVNGFVNVTGTIDLGGTLDLVGVSNKTGTTIEG